MNNSTVQAKLHNTTTSAKTSKKQQPKKSTVVEPDHPELVIKVLKELYVFDQIKIVSAHAPIIDLTRDEITKAIITVNPIDSDIIHNSVLRVHKDAKGHLHILSGKNTAMKALEEGAELVKARLISRSALWRTLVPQEDVVRMKIHNLAVVGGKNGIRVTERREKVRTDSVDRRNGADAESKKQAAK